MKYRSVFMGLGKILAFSAVFYVFPVIVVLIYKEYAALPGFLIAAGTALFLGVGCSFLARGANKIRHREALVPMDMSYGYQSSLLFGNSQKSV